MIKAVLFDLDGVLLSTDEYHYQAWKAISDKKGLHFDRTLNNELRGVSRMASLQIILDANHVDFPQEEKDALAAEKNEIYREFLKQITPENVPHETLVTLEGLRKRGIKMAIASSSKNARTILAQAGLTAYFDAMIDGNAISHSKPHPEVFLKAAEAVGTPLTECLGVDDAFAGVASIKAALIRAVGIGDSLKCPDIDFGVTHLDELLEIVDKENDR